MTNIPDKPDPMFDAFDNRVTLKGRLKTLTALRIGSGRSTRVTDTDLPIIRDATGQPYIPGSSFKGALRASIESILRSLSRSKNIVCDPLDRETWCLASPEKLSDEEVFAATCLVCRIFGSPWVASKINIRDLLVSQDTWFGQHEIRNGVAIDRDTGTARDGFLYDFEVVPAGTEFQCEIIVENAAPWGLGLLMIGLRPFELGEATLGGSRSRGLGVVEISWDSRTQISGGDGLLDYLAGDAPQEIGEAETKQWVTEFRSTLQSKLTGVAHA